MLRVPSLVDRSDRRSPWSRASLGAVIALSVGALIGGCDRHAPPTQTAAPPAEVGVVVVKTSAVGLQTELPGRVEPFRSANIAARVAGVLQKRLFVEGSEVRAGQLLYQIDPEPFKAAYDSATAGLLKSEATLAQAQDVLKRYTPLAVDGAVSQQALTTAQLNVQQGLADVASARANVQTARLNLGYASVSSPIAGRVSQTQVTEGALVGQGQVTPLTTVQQIDPVYINFTQSADDVLRLQRSLEQGQLKRVPGSQAASVRILLPDGTAYPLPGKLFFSGVTVDTSSGQITLRAEVPNPNRVLLPGLYARVRLEQAEASEAILLPQQAVTRTQSGNTVMVVAADGQVSTRAIQVSGTSGGQWVVLAGLQPGEQVMVDGFQKLRGKAPVKPVPWTGAKAAAAPPSATPAAAPATEAKPATAPAAKS
ncbi:efflux RND transporter periplasmic adaptor subunit [Curvibacter sp. HBC61]|uniref:Efflux RND transporter periplasmic adaptor subunit n=1 Tax=Curvibacter cyanobacteriorum TaxID=3026422 RepID=A0ABT5N6G1_9BURK|nr:efflux RND transporter periplasmic adaptor subunit [Curvibacter sp. HBC61]MDD0840698.1 efflux RND transporter periplasmic adaptor subunit [Curvibacter sp. HBC61]